MSAIEDRLRDAIRNAAETVSPRDAETVERAIRQRLGPAKQVRRRPWRVVAPIAAAAVVAGIALLAAVLGSPRPHPVGLGSASIADPKFMIVINSLASLQVRDAVTGAVVSRIPVPQVAHSQRPGTPLRHRIYISQVATNNGRTYLIALGRAIPCRSWLYKFTLNSKGHASALTPFTAMPTLAGAGLSSTDISGDGRYLAFATFSSGPNCPEGERSHIGVTNVLTGRTRQWSIPRTDAIDNVSLDANGGLLLYSLQFKPSQVRVIPTSAPPGPAANRGRTVIRAAQFGRSAWISFAAISPDARAVYFSVYPPGGGGPGQIRVTGLTARHSRKVAGNAEYPGLITADPRVLRIPIESDHLFRSNPITGSGVSDHLAGGL